MEGIILMSTFEKMKEKIMRTPTSNNIMPEELKNFLVKYGFVLKHVNGSHFIYEYPANNRTFVLNIPMHKPVKPTYIDQVRKQITEIEGE